MSPSFTARNIASASRLFFIFTPMYSPLKILFSHQVLAQYREKQESYMENIILSDSKRPRNPTRKHSKPEVRCSMLYFEESVLPKQQRQRKSILKVKVYYTAFFPREFTPTQSLDRRLSKLSARARVHGKIRRDLRKRPPQINECSNFNQTCKNNNTQHKEDFDFLLEGNCQIY